MMLWVKKARGYIASILLIYTVTVTYFLVRTAWSNGLDPWLPGSSNVKDKTFLKDLVREERRHLQNFQDVVHNYRGAEDEDGNTSSEVQRGQQGTEIEISDDGYNTSSNIIYGQNGKPIGSTLDLQIRGSGPAILVEVEEWDETIIERRRQEREHSASLSNQRAKKLGSYQDVIQAAAVQNQPQTPVPTENKKASDTSEYNTSYCVAINYKENVCLTQRVTFTHPDHATPSKFSMMFAPLGGLLIYSGFLDPRPQPALVRLITLGPSHQTNQSEYWCVFDIRRLLGQASLGDARGGFRNRTFSRGLGQQSTPLYYYAASDGHNKEKQFYIMSCKVPDELYFALNRSETIEVKVVKGSKESAMLDVTTNEHLVLPVINNFASRKALWRTSNERLSFLNVLSPNQNVDVNFNVNKKERFVSDDEEISIADDNSVVENNNFKNRHLLQVQQFGIPGEKQSNLNTNVNGKEKPLQAPSGANSIRGSNRDRLVSCVAPSPTPMAVVKIVEFIELSFLLGVQHVMLYMPPGLDEGVSSTLDMYQSQGLITVLPWKLSLGPDAVWARGRDVALNDCLYRTMFLFDFALFHDMDEFYVPRATPDLPSFLTFLRLKGGLKSNKHTDLVFSSAYFPPPTRPQYKVLTTAPGFHRDMNKFSTLKSVHRSYISNKHPLRMVNVTAAVRVGAGERQKTSFIISNRLASVNHYSQCPREPAPANQIDAGGDKVNSSDCEHLKVDWVLWRYKTSLIQNTKDNVRALQRLLRAKKQR